MSPGTNVNYDNGNGNRKVEFSGLPTIDSEAPEEPTTNHWDTETDHLLSYFLGDPGHSNPSHGSFQDFSSVPRPSSDMNPPLGMNASYGAGSSRTSSNSTLTEAADPPQPRTPAMQFYHHGSHSSSHSHSQQQTTSYARQTAENIAASMPGQSQMISSSSSSSLSSMAAALVSGGPVLHHQIHQRRHPPPTAAGSSSKIGKARANSDSPPGHGDDSPISPAAMIGTGYENLMLPPPSRKQSRDRTQSSAACAGPGTSGSQSSASTRKETQQHHAVAAGDPSQNSNSDGHLEWLKELNARAQAANQGPSNTVATGAGSAQATIVVPSMVAQQPQGVVPVVQHSMAAQGVPAVFHPAAFPNAAAAAAAVAQNPMLYQAALSHKFHLAAQSQGESEEKRARRLERNRESARKSRRRKKERLATLEAQVDRLHTSIEDERNKQVEQMCSTLQDVRKDELANLQNDLSSMSDQINSEEALDRLARILRGTSGGSQIAQATIEFQYNTLRQVLLPRYQKFLLWLTLHDEAFFMAGKEEYTRKDGKQVLRVSSGRVSSKQIGDELTNGWKTEKSDGKKKKKADAQDIAERSNPTSRAMDAARMWPLLCFELSISVDQEERLLQALKRLQQMENLSDYRSQLAAATKLTSNLTEATSSQCRIAATREDKSFLSVLTPEQSAKYFEWKAANQERCTRLLKEKRPEPEKSYSVFKETSLVEFCRRLEEALRISKKEN